MTDYSHRSLSQKLGIKPEMRVFIHNSPQTYQQEMADILKKVQVADRRLDFIHFFTSDKEELSTKFSTLKNMISYSGILWISWPKKASGLVTNIDENIVAGIGLSHGLVDTKVCSIDSTWSGLKFMYRIKDRK